MTEQIQTPVKKAPDPKLAAAKPNTVRPSQFNMLNEFMGALDRARAALKYFLILEEDAEPMKVQEFTTRELLVSALSQLLINPKPGMRVVLFQGAQLFITKGPYRYLVAGEEKVPLFVLPEKAEVDMAGYLVPEPDMEIKQPSFPDTNTEEEEDTDQVQKDTDDPIEDPLLKDDPLS